MNNPMLIGFNERAKREGTEPAPSNVTEVSANEYDALCLSLDKVRLRKRLNEAKRLLYDEGRAMFKPGIFKAGERALYSDKPNGLPPSVANAPKACEDCGFIIANNERYWLEVKTGLIFCEDCGNPKVGVVPMPEMLTA